MQYHFDKILDLAEIKNRDKRDLVPYSFRHYYITNMVKSNEINILEIANNSGTGIAHIEHTYYHTDSDTMTKNAYAPYRAKQKNKPKQTTKVKISANFNKNIT